MAKKNELHLVHMEYIPNKELATQKDSQLLFGIFILSTGFLAAFSLAILIPDYRMTMSQAATIFHGFGAIILALYIDPMVCRSLDNKLENSEWIENIYSIFIGRLLSYILASSIFLALFLYVPSN